MLGFSHVICLQSDAIISIQSGTVTSIIIKKIRANFSNQRRFPVTRKRRSANRPQPLLCRICPGRLFLIWGLMMTCGVISYSDQPARARCRHWSGRCCCSTCSRMHWRRFHWPSDVQGRETLNWAELPARLVSVHGAWKASIPDPRKNFTDVFSACIGRLCKAGSVWLAYRKSQHSSGTCRIL